MRAGEGLRPPDPFRERPAFSRLRTQDDMTLAALAELGPLLVVCLPALQTAVCRKWLERVAGSRGEQEANGRRYILVHMGSDDDARAAFEPFDLHYVARIADPERELYAHFGLGEAAPGLLARVASKVRGDHPIGDPAQAPGAFLVEGDETAPAALGAP